MSWLVNGIISGLCEVVVGVSHLYLVHAGAEGTGQRLEESVHSSFGGNPNKEWDSNERNYWGGPNN